MKIIPTIFLSLVCCHAMEEQSPPSGLKRKLEAIMPETTQTHTAYANKCAKTSLKDNSLWKRNSDVRLKISGQILPASEVGNFLSPLPSSIKHEIEFNNQFKRGKIEEGEIDITSEIMAICDLLQKDSVRSLKISSFDLKNEEIISLSAALRNAQSLKGLDLSGCGLSDTTLALLLEGLGEVPHLIDLDLQCNKITEKGMQALASFLTKNPNLSLLSLASNPLRDEGVLLLGKALRKGKARLKCLWIYDVEMTDKGARSLAKVLSSKNVALEELDIAANEMNDLGARSILKALIDDNKSLKVLDLGDTPIEKTSAMLLGSVISTHKTLSHLVLHGFHEPKWIKKHVIKYIPEDTSLSIFEAGDFGSYEYDELDKLRMEKLQILAKKKNVNLSFN